ncbi:MAG TPA: MBL fold metallo-hydrolase [Candidatus Obscuribacterales bacterium]
MPAINLRAGESCLTIASQERWACRPALPPALWTWGANCWNILDGFCSTGQLHLYITAYGAAYDVTGSCFLLETRSSRILVDCGLFQGSERLERQNKIPPAILLQRLDAMVLTHGHLDHCGRLPLLVKAGYRGPIFATQGTIDIAQLILADAAKIQQDDAERENRKRSRKGSKPARPLFTISDAQRVSKQFHAIDYDLWVSIADGIKIRLVEAGHILGSSSVDMLVDEGDCRKRIIFSGDLGHWNAPIMRDPAQLEYADMVFMESTYGDRDHRPFDKSVEEFEHLVAAAVKKGGKIFIPTFAVGRAQEVLYRLAEMFRKGIIAGVPIYLDSPMAVTATEIYARHQGLMDEEARALHQSGQLRKDLSTLKTSVTAEESKALNAHAGPMIVLAGAGMCNAGRILHHLRNNLSRAETLVIIVGYQVKGSLGRRLLEGDKEVKILGDSIRVRATVASIGGFSAHAGQSDLMRWLAPLVRPELRIVLVHGESHPMQELSHLIESRFGLATEIPKLGDLISF